MITKAFEREYAIQRGQEPPDGLDDFRAAIRALTRTPDGKNPNGAALWHNATTRNLGVLGLGVAFEAHGRHVFDLPPHAPPGLAVCTRRRVGPVGPVRMAAPLCLFKAAPKACLSGAQFGLGGAKCSIDPRRFSHLGSGWLRSGG